MTRLFHGAALFGALILVTGPAAAQAPPPPTSPPQAGAAASPNCPQTQASDDVARGAPASGAERPLSERLAQSNGVICPPPNVDPDIHQPAPDVGSMPVIPPPGSPGGNPSMEPK
jgi:hypothetical protein